MAGALLDDWIQELEATVGPDCNSSASISSPQAGERRKESDGEMHVAKLDIVVGMITKVWPHENSDKLFCENIDIGEESPRQIASGLQKFYAMEDLQDRMVLVLANLKGKKLGGFKSEGMVLCASNSEHTDVKFLDPPVGSKVGDRIVFEGVPSAPVSAAQVGKKKVLEAVFPDLYIGEEGVAYYKDLPFTVEGVEGHCTAPVQAGYQVN